MRRISLALKGDPQYIEQEVSERMSSCTLPVEIDVAYEYDQSEGRLSVDLDLPEIEDLPERHGVVLTSGTIKEKSKTQKQLKEEYVTCVLGLIVFVTASLFDISPSINEIVLSGYTQRRNKDGDLKDDYIISVRFTRAEFESIAYSANDPMETILEFENRMNITTGKKFKVIKPL